jgi:hypothetical protein
MQPITGGDISRYSDHVSFIIQDVFPDGPVSCVISRKDTRLVFPDWTGLATRLPDQDALYRFLAAEGAQWRFSITEEMLPSFEILTTNTEWLLKITLRESGHWNAGWGPVDHLIMQEYPMQSFNAPSELKDKRIIILPGGK